MVGQHVGDERRRWRSRAASFSAASSAEEHRDDRRRARCDSSSSGAVSSRRIPRASRAQVARPRIARLRGHEVAAFLAAVQREHRVRREPRLLRLVVVPVAEAAVLVLVLSEDLVDGVVDARRRFAGRRAPSAARSESRAAGACGSRAARCSRTGTRRAALEARREADERGRRERARRAPPGRRGWSSRSPSAMAAASSSRRRRRPSPRAAGARRCA